METDYTENGEVGRVFPILGCPCRCFASLDAAHRTIVEMVESGKSSYTVAINAEKVIRYGRDKKTRRIIDASALASPDGAGAVLGLRLLYGLKSIKLDLPKAALTVSDRHQYRVFVGGATEEVNRQAVAVIKERYSGLVVCGSSNGFVSKEEMIEAVGRAHPQIVMLALGSPKQELLAAELCALMPGLLVVGCGGALDVISGAVDRAPTFFIENNLEWLYRLSQNPARWRRQLALPVFVVRILIAALMQRGFAKRA